MSLRKMDFKGFLEKFTFRSRIDFDDDQDSRKEEKYWKILRKEVVVDRFRSRIDFDDDQDSRKEEKYWKILRKEVVVDRFRSRIDFDDDQDSRKEEKYWKILRKEVVVDRFMFDSAEFDHKVEAAFKIMKRSSEVREEALKWFESELKVEREKVWRKLMREKNIDLSSAMPYLIKINQADAAWRDMDDLSRGYVYEWQRRVNFTILEMFILRHKALPLSKRIKNALFRKKK